MPRHTPDPADLLLCQPAFFHPAQIDLALGIQHAWECDLLTAGLTCERVLLGRAAEGSGAQLLFHRFPLSASAIRRRYQRLPDGLPTTMLQSHLGILDPETCSASGWLSGLATGERVRTIEARRATRGMTALLDWMDDVVAQTCAQFGKSARPANWCETYETTDPREAVYLLHRSGAMIRENLAALDQPVALRLARPSPSLHLVA